MLDSNKNNSLLINFASYATTFAHSPRHSSAICHIVAHPNSLLIQLRTVYMISHHVIIIFNTRSPLKSVAAKILLRRWKEMIIAGRHIRAVRRMFRSAVVAKLVLF